MADNGNHQNQQTNAQLQRLIIGALEDPRYEWRTIDGIANQIGVPAAQVQDSLESLKQVVVRSSIPDEMGRSLYTTRKHYRDTHGLGSQLLAALSDKVT
jgi:hypothetical protein